MPMRRRRQRTPVGVLLEGRLQRLLLQLRRRMQVSLCRQSHSMTTCPKSLAVSQLKMIETIQPKRKVTNMCGNIYYRSNATVSSGEGDDGFIGSNNDISYYYQRVRREVQGRDPEVVNVR